MVECRNLSGGYFGTLVLKNISVTFEKGKVTVLLGPNGCGKSTLLKTILGLNKKSEGEIFLDGTEISLIPSKEVAKKLSYLPQSRNIPNITAERMVLHGRFPYLSYPRRYRREDYEKVEWALKQTGAYEIRHCSMQELSGGQRQKVYIAMALAQDTETILMDEPTTYLDVSHQLEVMTTAKELAKEGKAVVLVLHDLTLAMRYADQLVLMKDGCVVTTGSPEKVYESGLMDEVFQVHVERVETKQGYAYICSEIRGEE